MPNSSLKLAVVAEQCAFACARAHTWNAASVRMYASDAMHHSMPKVENQARQPQGHLNPIPYTACTCQ